jgi:glycosyltransferase involved in cell wall biosynthesis
VAIVTDLPVLMYVLKDKISFIDNLEYRIKNFLLGKADSYVVLTEAINNEINKKEKPFVVIEGFADILTPSNKNNFEEKISCKIIHYSGGLYEKFGVKALIDAFMLIDRDDIRLHLFGVGDLEKYIESCIQKDSRIEFFGYKENRVVLEDQLNSVVLVNPRFSHEEYTKYSFPSKTIEYMVSGVPLLTTKLPGIPLEYLNFVYLFEEENVEDYKNSLLRVINKPRNELVNFGMKARDFVLKNKNNKIQAEVFYKNLINNI